MPWPGATDYTTAVQDPRAAFADAELRASSPECNAFLGLPLSYCGNFAIVFKLAAPSGETWAVKCFTRQVTDHQQRYAAIARHLGQAKKRFAVDFSYLEQGVKVGGVWYPCVKMRWVEGHTLNEFLRDHCHHASLLGQLADLWLRLAGELRESRMAHGDLQHGNVLLVPGKSAAHAALRLVDYDGMWVPELDGRPPGERGHANYQHPQRLKSGGYSAELDRFALLAIYTALRCLRVGGKTLWERHDNGENLLFKESDFSTPAKSKLLPELLDLPDADAVALTGHLITASQGPIDSVPLLSDLLQSGSVQPLSGQQRDRLAGLVGKAGTTPAPRTKSSPRLQPEAAEAIAARLLREEPSRATLTPPPPPVPTASSGLTLGDYELLEELARGVSWRIYLARQGVTGRIVQLRTLTVEPLELKRVLGEAEVGSSLTHPNVLTTYEVGQRDGVVYLVSEDAPGGSLTRRLSRLRDDPRQVVPLLIQAARAVQFAHQHFILHRSLGSESVLLDADGVARVVGFGLSARGGRIARPFGGGPYAAPEVQRGEEHVGPAADVWALGALLYEGLTGQPPVLEGEDPSGPVPPWEINRDADPGLSDISLWCLKVEPRLRYPSAAKLAAELERWMTGEPVVITLEAATPAPPPLPHKAPPRSRARRSRGLPWPAIAAACVILLGLVGGAAWVLTRPPATPEVPPPLSMPGQSLVVRPGQPFQATFTAEGARGTPRLKFKGLPQGIKERPPAVRRNGEWLEYAVTFDVRPDVRAAEADVRVTLEDGKRILAEWHLRLTVPASGGSVGPPTDWRVALKVPALTVEAGLRETALVAIDRKNFSGPLTLRVKDLPAGIRVADVEAEEEETQTVVTFEVTAATPPGRYPGRVVAEAEGVVVGEAPIAIQVTAAKRAARPPTPR